jgi:23S rRNA pseudouridine1911/1915/1917 synthase
VDLHASGELADAPPYEVLLEDDAVIVVNKLLPLPVQPEKTGDPSLQDIIRKKLRGIGGAAPYLEAAHRIDRRSSGIVAFAKTQAAAADLGEQFRGEGASPVKKTYWAVVDALSGPEEGRLEHFLVWDARTGKSRAFAADPGKGAKKAILLYRLAGKSERYVLLEIEPLTGRTHQIRAQLAATGMSIRGDLKYGARRSTRNGLIMLHARSIAFAHPSTGVGIALTARPPLSEPLWDAFGPDEKTSRAAAEGTDPGGGA